MKNKHLLFLGFSLVLLLNACIPARQVEEIKMKLSKAEDERNSLHGQNKDLETQNKELQAKVQANKNQLVALRSDTTVLGSSVRRMTKQYDKINRLNDELINKQKELQQGNRDENQKLLSEYELMHKNLQAKEDQLKELERELNAKKANLDKLSTELNKSQKALDLAKIELAKRENRVKELEAIIAQKDASVKKLKEKITEALLGFKDKGLTIEQKKGRIYVSMEAKLLFAKGSTKVDVKGKDILIKLAKVLETQEDISILIEGHTDSDKLSGKGVIKDNWDLSVMRATSVVRILANNSKIAPKSMTAAGRGAFVPVDEGKDEAAKSKNRRIEIVLAPNLDELFEILNQ